MITDDHSRVILKGDSKHDYINASFIDVSHKKGLYKMCLKSQLPSEIKINHFFNNTWLHNILGLVKL